MSLRSRAAPAASWLAILFLGVADADALSLRSAKAEAFLGDVRPGSVVVLSSAAAGALSVENSGTEPATVEVSVENPSAERLQDGYEPLPDMSWIVVKEHSRALDVGASWVPEVRLAVPSGRSLEGGQYQFDLVFKGSGPGGSGLTLRTAVTLMVGDGEPVDVAPEAVDAELVLSPARARLEGVALGQRVAARSGSFRALKLANGGETKLLVRLTPARRQLKSIRLENGYTPAPNPNWLKTGPPVHLAAGSVSQAAFELEIPRQKRYRGRKFAFVVAVDAEGGGRRRRSWWTMYVQTLDEEESRIP